MNFQNLIYIKLYLLLKILHMTSCGITIISLHFKTHFTTLKRCFSKVPTGYDLILIAGDYKDAHLWKHFLHFVGTRGSTFFVSFGVSSGSCGLHENKRMEDRSCIRVAGINAFRLSNRCLLT